MKTQTIFGNSAGSAAYAHGKGFYRGIWRFVSDRIEERGKRNMARRTAEELAGLPDYLKKDIDWPAIANHEKQ